MVIEIMYRAFPKTKSMLLDMKTVEIIHVQKSFNETIGLETKRLRILSLGGIDKIRNHLVANTIYEPLIF